MFLFTYIPIVEDNVHKVESKEFSNSIINING